MLLLDRYTYIRFTFDLIARARALAPSVDILFFTRLIFETGILEKTPAKASAPSEENLLLSTSRFLRFYLSLKAEAIAFAPAVSISFPLMLKSSRVSTSHKTLISLMHPSFVILLSLTLTFAKNSLPTKQFATTSIPASPNKFPATLSSLRLREFDKHTCKALIPSWVIEFFFSIRASKYFLFLNASPKAIAPFAYMLL